MTSSEMCDTGPRPETPVESELFIFKMTFRPDFTSKLVHGFAFGTPRFYLAPYGKINHGLVNLGPVVQSIVSLTAR